MVDASAPPRLWRNVDVLVVSPTPTHPQDHGNRKRIYEYCAELKRQGARIHFVYYPAEHDWRRRWPLRYENEMAATWDSYHLVAPSRRVHEDSIGRDHLIDEWADPSLTAYLSWACRMRDYDAAIVNYTWMSFCLEAIPASVFKILDTHDAFGTRRDLFEAHGLNPEFFHTTKAEEAKGLQRADLVWAIKQGEQSYFERELGLACCLTMLHAEPERGWWNGPPSTDGWLRAGVIGARNSVNKRNLEEFLAAALPILHRYMAPVKIVIGGGCSDDFSKLDHPNVEVIGRVADVADFYRDIDVAIAPVQFSTGLKIKVAEALASGAPVIAHAHAMEGFPARERLHRLPSFEEMALELVKLSFDRAPLDWLASRSHAVCAATRQSALEALQRTQALFAAREAKTICIVAPIAAFDPKSVLSDHLVSSVEALRGGAAIAVLAVGRPAAGARIDALEGHWAEPRVFAEPETIDALGAKIPDHWRAASLADLLETRGYRALYLMTDDVADIVPELGSDRTFLVRRDAIALAGGDADALVARLGAVVEVDAEPRSGRGRAIEAPFVHWGRFRSLSERGRPEQGFAPLLVLAAAADPIAAATIDLARELKLSGVVLDPRDAATTAALLGVGDADPFAGFSDLQLIVDLSDERGAAALIAEAALRAQIPRLALQRGAIALGLRPLAPLLYPATVGQLLRAVAVFACDPRARADMRSATRHEADGRFVNHKGWPTAQWELSSAAEKTPDAAAALWG